MKQYILTVEQFAFMKKHHAEIEYSMVYSEPGAHDFIDDLVASEEWKAVFGNMLWDDAYDRYEDTPGYDRSLKLELKAKLAGISPEELISNSTENENDADVLFLAEQLIRIRDEARNKLNK